MGGQGGSRRVGPHGGEASFKETKVNTLIQISYFLGAVWQAINARGAIFGMFDGPAK